MKALLGKEIGVTQYFKITQDRINAFADTTGNLISLFLFFIFSEWFVYYYF